MLSEIGEEIDDEVRKAILSNSRGMERIDDLEVLEPPQDSV
jgi:flavoprotein